MPKKPAPSPLNLASAAYARAVHHGTPEQIAAARTALNEARVRAWAEKTLADAPPLTDETRARLARLLTVQDGGNR